MEWKSGIRRKNVVAMLCIAIMNVVIILTYDRLSLSNSLNNAFKQKYEELENQTEQIQQELAEDGQKDLRPVMIHAQLVREDQLKRMARIGMMASFFTAHTYYWGDIHLQNFGEERAKKISPAKTASKYGVPFTFHQDSPVLLPNMIETIWCAVNRISREGKDMGHAERISTLEALKAITSMAAYQYREEDKKGSIKEGKVADFVILDRNPLEVEKEELREIRILATIKEDRMVYRAEGV